MTIRTRQESATSAARDETQGIQHALAQPWRPMDMIVNDVAAVLMGAQLIAAQSTGSYPLLGRKRVQLG
jgi:hypothetical protein